MCFHCTSSCFDPFKSFFSPKHEAFYCMLSFCLWNIVNFMGLSTTLSCIFFISSSAAFLPCSPIFLLLAFKLTWFWEHMDHINATMCNWIWFDALTNKHALDSSDKVRDHLVCLKLALNRCNQMNELLWCCYESAHHLLEHTIVKHICSVCENSYFVDAHSFQYCSVLRQHAEQENNYVL